MYLVRATLYFLRDPTILTKSKLALKFIPLNIRGPSLFRIHWCTPFCCIDALKSTCPYTPSKTSAVWCAQTNKILQSDVEQRNFILVCMIYRNMIHFFFVCIPILLRRMKNSMRVFYVFSFRRFDKNLCFAKSFSFVCFSFFAYFFLKKKSSFLSQPLSID